jgi:hypothetical protein
MAGENVPVHQENVTSVAIDGAWIGCFLAISAVSVDPDLDDGRRGYLLTALEVAAQALDEARANLPVIITSLHRAGGLGG